MKHKKGGAGWGFDGAQVDDDDEAVWGDEIYTHASSKAREALKEEEDLDDVQTGQGREIQEFDGGFYKG